MTKFTAYLILIVGNIFSSYSQFQNQGVVYSDELAEPVFYFSVDSAQCADSKDGSIVLWNENEFIDSIIWENGERSFERLDLSPGIYSLQLYLNYGVMYQYDFLVASPPPLETVIELIEQRNSIELNAEVIGGVEPYTFEWSNGINLANISTSSSGYFTVEVTDDRGCVDLKDIYLEPSQISNSINTSDLQVVSSEVGSFSIFIKEKDFELVCYSLNGQKVRPSVVEESQLKFSKLSKGYYFLIGQIGEQEVMTKVFVL